MVAALTLMPLDAETSCMNTIRFVVTFNEQVPLEGVASMITGMAASGIVHPGSSDRQYIIEVFRLSNVPSLESKLTQWDLYGFLRWTEESSN